MRRVILDLLIVGTVFILPVAWSGTGLDHPAPWLAAASWWLVLAGQPPLRLSEAISSRVDSRQVHESP